ncbi:YecA family protein [Desulfobulbus oligotrophicus]|uniref:SEC-C domain-containing protein n=1 Tax=Desulfobulbus oligotrophicus TaxID=1909699 RepID=A0A7T5VF96_9BACT|nr:SEC-C metal-binding domain-containing protein [Desulfobulbus oligotrophicus]QQG66692.1 SEC-C domain-containing protein [Desulfobulbus oligotrophicus]
MGKIGRNQPCPCGSGKKYKHCCLSAQQAGAVAEPTSPVKVSLLATIEKVQTLAEEKKEVFLELGVFLFFADHKGDAWLFEITDSDAVQIAKNGERLAVQVNENPETIEINFSHTFALHDREVYVTSYVDKVKTLLVNSPAQQINAAIRRLRKRFPKEMLAQMHVEQGEETSA